jgi:hypothetical protein
MLFMIIYYPNVELSGKCPKKPISLNVIDQGVNIMGFERWWQNTYAGKLGVQIIEDSFKEVAKAAWDEQQKELNLAYEAIGRNAIRDAVQDTNLLDSSPQPSESQDS